jgi:ribonucleotide reductase alpha subunit
MLSYCSAFEYVNENKTLPFNYHSCNYYNNINRRFKTPPDEIYGFELNEFDKIKFRVNDSIIDLNSDEIEFWKTLTFKKAENEYPGETPDFNVNLVGLKTHYSAIYNHSSPIVFFFIFTRL